MPASGIEPDPAKVDNDVTSVRSFLGLASYYCHFVRNFANTPADEKGCSLQMD